MLGRVTDMGQIDSDPAEGSATVERSKASGGICMTDMGTGYRLLV